MSNERPPLWVIDDDRSVRFVLVEALRDAGHRVSDFESADAALEALADPRIEAPSLVFTDVRMPGTDGLAFLDRVKAVAGEIPVVVMSAWTNVAATSGAFRGGALEFLSKPFDLDEACALAARVLETEEATEAEPRSSLPDRFELIGQEIIGDSAPMQSLYRAIGRLARAPLSVLIRGETGTGKELVARALHRHSPRADKPFIAINTAAIPTELLESELFGHEAGAFTGARERRHGRFEQANGGTLFLDEIGDMPLPLQTRLLRVLAEDEFFRVGGRELIQVDVRVIAATHQDLDAKVGAGEFRADLLHRLDVVRLDLPPLRERREDIPLLAEHFLQQAAEELGLGARRWSKDAMARLVAHDWPGNVRELENLSLRVAALASGETLRADDLPAALRGASVNIATDDNGWQEAFANWCRGELEAGRDAIHARAIAAAEAVLIREALAVTDGHKQNAAARLGIGRNTLTRKLK
ncbi:MAG: nitrogen regulation protein NR(I) [Lysobacteraceae bacterium]